MNRAAFDAVAAESRDRPGYDAELHERIHALVCRWADGPGGAAFGATDSDRDRHFQYQACRDAVFREYRQSFGMPWFLVPILYGIISFLVQRTLEVLFPQHPESTSSPSAPQPFGQSPGPSP